MNLSTLLVHLLTALCALGALSGCMGPIALSNAVPDYDETITQLQGKALLLNIARSRHHMPPHFTDTTSVVATFNFQTDAILTGGTSSNVNSTLELGGSLAENPTIELTPLRGEEYSRQLLTPLTDNQFRMLATEGLPLDLLIRLMGKSFHFQNERGEIVSTVRNNPAFPQEYRTFRQVAIHLAALNARAKLFARRVAYVEIEEMVLPEAPSASDLLEASKSGFEYQALGANKYALSQQVIGNTVVTNFDTNILSDAQRTKLNRRISLTPGNLVDIDIRSGFPGGDFPIHGFIQLRSISEILDFIARGIVDLPEYQVAPDARTEQLMAEIPDAAALGLNPARVIAINESDERPEGSVLQVKYRDSFYSVQQEQWDLLAFKSLYILMQMSGQTPTERAFPITISK